MKVLDADNALVGEMNLTESNLAEAENYEALKQMLIDAAE